MQLQGADKRTKHIKLTDKAIQDYEKWESAVAEMEKDLLSGLPESTCEPLRTYIQQWLFHIRNTERK
jgi:DNA-binding MarR family transcriptional regulator